MPKCVLCLYSLRFLIHQKEEEGDFPFGIEDLLYYVKRIEEQQFNLDVGALKQYFPFNLVMLGILKICHDLVGNFMMFPFLVLVFSLANSSTKLSSSFASFRFKIWRNCRCWGFWHSDVHLYSVYDLSSSELLGYFYLDMFSRFINFSWFN